MPQDTLPLRHVVVRDHVPEAGLEIEILPKGEALESIAKFLSIPAVDSLRARLDVQRHGRGGLRVRGNVEAQVVQSCVVTLEPVSALIDERVDTIYAPENSPILNIELTAEELASEESDIEPMANGSIDLGGLVMEHVALGLDPYPRKGDVEFEPVEEDTGRESPFAALARLKGREGDA